jgi:Ras family protein T1
MYAIDNDGSSERLKRFWLKELRDRGRTPPVIVVGNKLDLMGQDDEKEYHRIFKVIK